MKIILSLIVMAFVTRSGCPYYFVKTPLPKPGIHSSGQPALQERQTATTPQVR